MCSSVGVVGVGLSRTGTGTGRRPLPSSGEQALLEPSFPSLRTLWSVVKLLTSRAVRFKILGYRAVISVVTLNKLHVFSHVFRNASRRLNNRVICCVGIFLCVEFKNYVLTSLMMPA